MFGWGGKILRTAELQDSATRAAAELIDERVGRERNHEITERDLRKASSWLAEHRALVASGSGARSPMRGLGDLEIDAIERALPRLDTLLHGRRAPERAPFASSLAVGAIVDPDRRACAALVAQTFGASTGERDAELSYSELVEAKGALGRLASGELARSDPALAERLAAAPSFDAENLAAIELFMTSGKGGLVSMGEVEIAGIRFQDAYLLTPPPAAETTTAAAPGTPKPRTKARKTKAAASEIEVPSSFRALSRPATHAAGDKMATRHPTKEPDPVEVAELMMQNSRFDRVYVYRDDGARLILRHDRGGLDKLQPGFRVKLPGDQSGTVIRVVDLNNSARETVFGFWGKVARNTSALVRGKFLGELDRTLDDAALGLAKDAGDAGLPAKPSSKSRADLKGMVATVAGAAGLSGTLAAGGAVAAPFLGIPAVLGGSLGLVAGVTGANLVEARLRKQDLTPLYHAIGVAVNRREAVVY